MSARVTRIRACGETWEVPRGFGAAYRRVFRHGFSPHDVVDLLALIGHHTTVGQVDGWGQRQRVEAMVYAMNAHARASDNPIPRHPRPGWLGVSP